MAVKSDYVTGTITLTTGISTFTGGGTAWALAGFREGDEIVQVAGQTQWSAMVATITSNTGGTLVRPWGGATGTYAYRMRFQPDGSRVTAQARELIELLGDGTLLSLAGLVGPGVIELLPGGGAQVVPKTDLVSGANYDVQVANLAGRATYDGQAAGFSVLVSDAGDGRAAIYSKITNASGAWTAPAYVTGPTGPMSTVPGVVWRGTYAAGTTYAVNDGVTSNGSSFRKLTTAAAGTAPSSASPPVNTGAWEVLAAKGTNGTGTGDFVGPDGGVTDAALIAFDGTTGKLGKAATMPTARFKGRVTAATGPIEDLTAAQMLTGIGAQPDLGWKPGQVVKLTATASSIVLAVPLGSTQLRITGSILMSTITALTYARISENGGTTYLSSAGTYFASALWFLTNGIASVNSGAAAAQMLMAVEPGDSVLRSNVDIQFDFGGTGWLSAFTKQASLDAQNRFVFIRNWKQSAGVPTHIQLFPSAGTFAAGTNLLAEAF